MPRERSGTFVPAAPPGAEAARPTVGRVRTPRPPRRLALVPICALGLAPQRAVAHGSPALDPRTAGMAAPPVGRLAGARALAIHPAALAEHEGRTAALAASGERGTFVLAGPAGPVATVAASVEWDVDGSTRGRVAYARILEGGLAVGGSVALGPGVGAVDVGVTLGSGRARRKIGVAARGLSAPGGRPAPREASGAPTPVVEVGGSTDLPGGAALRTTVAASVSVPIPGELGLAAGVELAWLESHFVRVGRRRGRTSVGVGMALDLSGDFDLTLDAAWPGAGEVLLGGSVEF